MKLRTEIEPLSLQGLIDHSTKIVAVGSCFTDEIGGRLRSRMFDICVNPFGTLYNPESIALEIERALAGIGFCEDDLFEENGIFLTMRRHSSFAGNNAPEMVRMLNHRLDETACSIRNCDLLIVTFGSAIAFRHNETGMIVANCHKRPSSEFTREFMSPESIVIRWRALIKNLMKNNSKLKVILTVSPVRHAGYGLVTDRVSKSALCLACDTLVNEFDGKVIYFPSYEILVDDLRDYRFYKDDLIHPSALAVDYIFDIFGRSFMSTITMDYSRQWQKLAAGCSHRFRDDLQKKEFLAQTERKVINFAQKMPGISALLVERFKKQYL